MAEGSERAEARCVRLGRKPKRTAHQQQESRRRGNSGKEILADIGPQLTILQRRLASSPESIYQSLPPS
jgi:hypothetical protein